ncbi:MAG: helicase-related protein, partial [Gammaproteobacteria bacterium]
QYFDSVWWLAARPSSDMPNEEIGVYAGAAKSGVIKGGVYKRTAREHLKAQVRKGDLRLILGTDAASEGLNLQRLGTLINLDLPWNSSRLEQRKGRIQRIGQVRDRVDIYNLRYAGSVEDRVHQMLSSRLQDISNLFGQLPDVLENVWSGSTWRSVRSSARGASSMPFPGSIPSGYATIRSPRSIGNPAPRCSIPGSARPTSPEAGARPVESVQR